MWWRNAWMLKCRRVLLARERPSRYGKLRREPRRDGLSTIEAAAMLMARLERNPKIEAALNTSFAKMLERYRAAHEGQEEDWHCRRSWVALRRSSEGTHAPNSDAHWRGPARRRACARAVQILRSAAGRLQAAALSRSCRRWCCRRIPTSRPARSRAIRSRPIRRRPATTRRARPPPPACGSPSRHGEPAAALWR